MNINNRTILLSFEYTPGYIYTAESRVAGVYISSDLNVLRLVDLPEKVYMVGESLELTNNKKEKLDFTGIIKSRDDDEFWFSRGKLLKF